MPEWEDIARTEEFENLVARRRRFMVVGMLVWAAWCGASLICCAVARGFMGQSIYEGFTVAYAWALSIILLTWGLAWLSGRVSARSLDPLAERAAAQVERETFVDRPAPGRKPVGDQERSRR
jgi:uncharacterized membrane protein (DUF485 family)